MYPCGICKEKFFSYDDLRDHLEGHKSQILKESEIKSEPVFDQDFDEGNLILDCVKEEEQLQVQQEEIRNGEDPSEGESSSETFMCSKCSYKSTSKQKFKAHMNVMHQNKYKCDQCPKRYFTNGILANHKRKEHEENKTNLPEDEFFRRIEEQAVKRKKTIYECLECTFKANTKPNIYLHIRGVHKKLLEELYKSKGMENNNEGYQKCAECFYTTLYFRHLRIHMKTVHQKRRDFVCDLCEKAYSARKTLVKHLKSIHFSGELQNCKLELHKCPMCMFKTADKCRLKQHVNVVHLQIRKFTCDLCQKQCSFKAQLRAHIDRIHLGKIHINIHSCNHGRNCSFKTTKKLELMSHIRRVHQKMKGVSCKFCGKWYGSHNGLSQHRRKHYMEGISITYTLTCDLCQKSFTARASMHRHMKKVHLKKESE